MKVFILTAFMAIATFANAQPGHYKDHGRGHQKKDYHKKYKKRKHHDKECDYRVRKEMNRYDFLRLSNIQRSKLQVSINLLISKDYSEREYENRLKRELYQILSRDQYKSWESRAYRGGNTFVFNFGS